jgi:hypothetical protein
MHDLCNDNRKLRFEQILTRSIDVVVKCYATLFAYQNRER